MNIRILTNKALGSTDRDTSSKVFFMKISLTIAGSAVSRCSRHFPANACPKPNPWPAKYEAILSIIRKNPKQFLMKQKGPERKNFAMPQIAPNIDIEKVNNNWGA